MCDRCIQYSAQNHLKGPPFLSKDGGGGGVQLQNTQKYHEIPFCGFGFFWVFRVLIGYF